jgi:hypothetical protein
MHRPYYIQPTPQQESLLKAILYDHRGSENTWGAFTLGEYLDPEVQWLLPLLYRKLPKDKLNKLGSRLAGNVYRHTWYKNNLLFHEAERIFHSLAVQGKPIVYLKGAALAVHYYRDLGVRPIDTFDVLMPNTKLSESLACLADHQWSANIDASTDAYLQYVDALGRIINVHRLLFDADLDLEVVARIEQCELSSQSVFALNPVNQLYHILATIPTWDQRSSLLWIIDAATVIMTHSNRINWDALVSTAIQNDQQGLIRNGLKYLHELLALDIPNSNPRFWNSTA